MEKISVSWRVGWVFVYKGPKLVKAMPTLWRDPYTMAQSVKKVLKLN